MQRYAQFAKQIPYNDSTAVSGLPFMDFQYNGKVVYHTVKYNETGRLDLIAYMYLKDPTLWYPIALYNGIIDPIAEIVPGLELAIPVDPIPATAYIPFTYPGVE